MSPSNRTGDPFSAFSAPGDGPTVAQALPRRATAAPNRDAAPFPSLPLAVEAIMASGLNPLVAAATPLLLCAPRIRAMPRHDRPADLRQALADGLRAFETQARLRGQPHEQVIAARYILCTVLDEAAASSAWGGSGAWSAHSLLVQFHNETWGGEKVFRLLSRLAENPDTNRRLLELLYLVIALGFEGRFRVAADGRAKLENLRKRLAQLFDPGITATERGLSPRWQPAAHTNRAVRGGPPFGWLLAAGVVLSILASVFAGLQMRLADRAEPLREALSGLQPRTAALPPQPLAAQGNTPPAPTLPMLLKPDVEAGRLTVTESPTGVLITIAGDGRFVSGLARVSPDFAVLLARIGTALATRPGAILITGHTDDQRIANAAHRSNQDLSLARAEAVEQALRAQLPASRLHAEGRADREPLADNRTLAGRARNRRVEITLVPPPAPATTP